ncbi:MAG: hypothetical protein M1827_003065 [Pycnora praestabilis]|nr:MAG: hypothetical protein M1827_003065 [Pycnora praestabilis]
MRLSSSSLLLYLSSLAFTVVSSAAISEVGRIEARQNVTVDCSNTDQTLQTECWDGLDVSSYLQTWYQANSSICNNRQLGFAVCYLELNGVYNQQSCNITGQDLCDLPTNLTKYTAEEAYVIFSIHAINQWFNSIQTAVYQADITSTGPIGTIVELLDPPKSQNKGLSEFLVALGASVGSIRFPGALIGLSKEASIGLTPVMQQTPGLLKYLYPLGTLSSQVTQISEIQNHLSTLITTMAQNINNALAGALNDPSIFYNITLHGNFIAPPSSLIAQTENITGTLQTFVISECMQANNIFLSLAEYTNPQQWVTNGTLAEQSYIDCASYNEYGVCSAWWYDTEQNNAYGLDDGNSMTQNYFAMMNTLFSNWTTGEELLRASKECADYVFAGGEPYPSIDPQTLEVRCIGNLPLCVYDQQCKASGNPSCLWTDDYPASNCTGRNSDYGHYGCNGNENDWSVSSTYLGPLLYDQSTTICRDSSSKTQ